MKKPVTQQFAVSQPPIMIVGGEDKISFTIHVAGGAALALRTGAVIDKESLLAYITKALAFQAASALADTNVEETPAYAELFGLEKEAAR